MGTYINAKEKKYRNLKTTQMATNKSKFDLGWERIFGKKEKENKSESK